MHVQYDAVEPFVQPHYTPEDDVVLSSFAVVPSDRVLVFFFDSFFCGEEI